MARHEAPYSGLGEGEDILDFTATGAGANTANNAAPWYAAALTAAIPAAAAVYSQAQLSKLNVARTKAGLAPVTAQQYSTVYQPPSAQVTVGPSASAEKLFLYGALGLGGFLALRALKVL